MCLRIYFRCFLLIFWNKKWVSCSLNYISHLLYDLFLGRHLFSEDETPVIEKMNDFTVCAWWVFMPLDEKMPLPHQWLTTYISSEGRVSWTCPSLWQNLNGLNLFLFRQFSHTIKFDHIFLSPLILPRTSLLPPSLPNVIFFLFRKKKGKTRQLHRSKQSKCQ